MFWRMACNFLDRCRSQNDQDDRSACITQRKKDLIPKEMSSRDEVSNTTQWFSRRFGFEFPRRRESSGFVNLNDIGVDCRRAGATPAGAVRHQNPVAPISPGNG